MVLVLLPSLTFHLDSENFSIAITTFSNEISSFFPTSTLKQMALMRIHCVGWRPDVGSFGVRGEAEHATLRNGLPLKI